MRGPAGVWFRFVRGAGCSLGPQKTSQHPFPVKSSAVILLNYALGGTCGPVPALYFGVVSVADVFFLMVIGGAETDEVIRWAEGPELFLTWGLNLQRRVTSSLSHTALGESISETVYAHLPFTLLFP